jgi:glyoxylase I family protein
MIRVRMIDHVVLRTSQTTAMVQFYSDVLGCKVERNLPAETGLVQLRAGKSLIDLVAVDSELGRTGGGPPSLTGNNMDHFCLQISAQPEQEISRYLASHGIEAGAFERRYGAQGFGNSVYLLDPEGNIVELRNQV